jgi:hypothetical protein
MSSEIIFIFRIKERVTDEIRESFSEQSNVVQDAFFIQIPAANISLSEADIFGIHPGDSYESLQLDELLIAEFDTTLRTSTNAKVLSVGFPIEYLAEQELLALLDVAYQKYKEQLN